MASSGDIIPRMTIEPCSTEICATVYSPEPRHWFLLWSNKPPAKTPRYITIRGITRQCGFTYSAAGWNCVEQQEPGATLQHTWCFDGFTVDQELWFAISESCSLRRGFFTSAPLVYRFADCGPGMRTYRVRDNTTTPMPHEPAWGAASFQQADYDTDGCSPNMPTAVLRLCGQGWFTVTVKTTIVFPPGFPHCGRSAFVAIDIFGEKLILGIQTDTDNQTYETSFSRDIYNPSFGVSDFQLVVQGESACFPFYNPPFLAPPTTVTVAPQGWPTNQAPPYNNRTP